jgi:hypothetical protein
MGKRVQACWKRLGEIRGLSLPHAEHIYLYFYSGLRLDGRKRLLAMDSTRVDEHDTAFGWIVDLFLSIRDSKGLVNQKLPCVGHPW